MGVPGGGDAPSGGDPGKPFAEGPARQAESRGTSGRGEADETRDEIHRDRVSAAREDGEGVDAGARWARAGVAEPYLRETARGTFSEVYFRDYTHTRGR